MAINKNAALIVVALAMTLAMWMVPESITAQNQHKRLLQLTSFNTNQIRTQSVTKFCAHITSRADLISKDQIQTSKSYKAELAKAFLIDASAFTQNLIDGKTDDLVAAVKTQITAFGLFIGFFIVGFVIFIFQWMFLCCCCCCPSCCPSKCCQKDENEQYSKCELYWPSIFLVLLLLMIIIVGAIGLAKSSTFKEGMSDFQCATAITFDDILNGNVTKDGKNFFIGASTISLQLGNLKNKMSNITGELNNLNTGLTSVVNSLTTAKTNVRKVPANNDADGNAVIVYYGKISDPIATATTPFNSLFVTALGSSGNGGIIGGFYDVLNNAFSLLNGIKQGAGKFSTNSSSFSGAIDGIRDTLGKFITQIQDVGKSISDVLDMTQSPKTIGSLIISLFYGVALGLAVLALLAVILMTFCNQYKCRYLMYFSCVLLFFFGLIGFILAILFSVIIPVLYFACDWISVTITYDGFNKNLGSRLDLDLRRYVSPCLPQGGDGNILKAIAPDSYSGIQNLQNSILNSSSFNVSSNTAQIDTALANITQSLNDVMNGVIVDTDNLDALNALKAIANTQGTSFFTPCANAVGDSWLLSLSNTTFSSCNIAGGAQTTTCSAANLLNKNSVCSGCMDASLLLNTNFNAQGGVKTMLDTRYVGCASFNSYLGNIWDNYFFHKFQAMNSIQSRWTTASNSLTPVKNDLNSVTTTFSNFLGNISAAADGVTNPKFGLIAGLNCLIVGEDLQTMISSICVSNFNTFYITRLLMGIGAFAILFAMCCIVCSGVRHFKHSERTDKISPNFASSIERNKFENTEGVFRS